MVQAPIEFAAQDGTKPSRINRCRVAAAQNRPIYKISPCFSVVRCCSAVFAQPARGRDSCRSLILNTIYKNRPGSGSEMAVGGALWGAILNPLLRRFAQRDESCEVFSRVFSITGKVLAHHCRSLPICRPKHHASLDKSAHLRLCRAHKKE